jgi:hypothetical protein
MKQIVDLRPVYHRREDRICAHVLLCCLALLLVRIAETITGRTWPTSVSSCSGCTCPPSPPRSVVAGHMSGVGRV